MRLAAAIAVIAVTWSAAVWLHEYTHLRSACGAGASNPQCYFHPAWANSFAVLVALFGIAIAVGIAYRPRGQRHLKSSPPN